MNDDPILIERLHPNDLSYTTLKGYAEKLSRQIRCFDFDEVEIPVTLDYIGRLQKLSVEEPQIVVPCMMALCARAFKMSGFLA